MTAVLEFRTESSASPADAPGFASWPARAGALAADLLPGVAVISTMALVAATTPQWGAVWWVFIAAAALAGVATVVNRWLLPPLTGWSLGRALFGIRVVRPSDVPVGSSRLALRDAAHLLDTASLFVGWLWPLWDRRNRTFGDLLLRTEVRVVAPGNGSTKDSAKGPANGNARRNAGIVFVVAALLCAAGSGLAYQSVYHHNRAVQQTRAEVAAQGPRMVEDMLSYGTDTVKEDFARALSSTTDGYRPQLAAQQQAVEKPGLTPNEYWTTNSAVLSAAPDQAAMLLALQGQRGADPKNMKFLTATVQVKFQKSGDGKWLVDGLTVLTQPQYKKPAQ